MDSSRIYNIYAADGTKLRSVYKTNAATLLFPIGHLCEQEQVEYATRTVDYCGGVRYEHDGNYHNTVIYNTEGYYSQTDSAFYAYQKDYQGNIAQVWNIKTGQLVQLTEYFPDGTPTPRTIGEEAQPYKYNGNEWVRFNGADMYDFNARMYYPAAPRFGSIDPLAEKYYAVSPYAFCGGNFVKYSDPSGMKFDFSNLEEEERNQIISTFEEARQSSELFNKLYTALDESPTVYAICLGGTTSVNGEQVNGQYNPDDNSISFLDVNSATSPTVYIEEMFHAYQKGENSGLYSQEEFNYEFEAKVAKKFIINQLDEYAPYPSGGDQTIEQVENINQHFNHLWPSAPLENNTEFNTIYKNNATSYSKYNILNNYGNEEYKYETKQTPKSLYRLFH